MIHLPNKPFPVIQKFLKDNDRLIYKYMVWCVYDAIKNNKESTELFSFADGNTVAVVRSKDFIQVLSDAITKFTTYEEHEYVEFANSVLIKWHVEQLINPTPTE